MASHCGPGSVAQGGKAARGELAVLIGCAEQTRGIELPRADLCDAFDDAAGIVLLAEQRHEGMIEIGDLPPVERRMGIEDLQAAHQHDEQAKRVDPVQRAHRARVPVKELSVSPSVLAAASDKACQAPAACARAALSRASRPDKGCFSILAPQPLSIMRDNAFSVQFAAGKEIVTAGAAPMRFSRRFPRCAMAKINIGNGIEIDESELDESFVRASGPGGQNVNKVSTAVQLRFDVARSPSLPGRRARATGEAGRPAHDERRRVDHRRQSVPHPGAKSRRRANAADRTDRAGRRTASASAPQDAADQSEQGAAADGQEEARRDQTRARQRTRLARIAVSSGLAARFLQ